MVDLTFTSRATHFVPLTLLRYIASSPPPPELDYLGNEDVKAIKGYCNPPLLLAGILTYSTAMALVSRGRLSVQRVEENAWDAVVLLAERGGWDGLNFAWTKSNRRRVLPDESEQHNETITTNLKTLPVSGRKRKAEGVQNSLRQSTRVRK
jgi:hypothetical protein